VTDTTKNQGGGEAGSTITRFYLSTNTTFDAADTAVGERAVPGLSAGQTNAGSTAVTIPAATAAGTYYIIARPTRAMPLRKRRRPTTRARTPSRSAPTWQSPRCPFPQPPVPVGPSR